MKRTIIQRAISNLAAKGYLNFLPDIVFLKLNFWTRTGEKLDLIDPNTYNEKLQWLKLYDRKPIYTIMVDKYEVKKYVANIIGKEHIIPTIDIWENIEDIDMEKLPEQFVLKCTHNSGGTIICKEKAEFDIKRTKNELKYYLRQNYYWNAREWPYKNVKPRVIAEKYMVDKVNSDLKDYKIFCFSGRPRIIQVDFDRFTNHRHNYYDTDWNFLDFYISAPNDKKITIERPKLLSELLDTAKKLSANIPEVRVDLYIVDDQVYFGELTLFHISGMGIFSDDKWNYKMGEWIELPYDKTH